MATKRWALSVPLDGLTLAEHVEIAQAAERLGYTDAWSLEVDGVVHNPCRPGGELPIWCSIL